MNVLFAAYHPVSHSIMLSQGLPYMRGLAKKGVRYSLLTFETKKSIASSKRYILGFDVPLKWRRLKYHSKPRIAATVFDIILGGLAVMHMIIRDKINVIHARGLIPALIAFIPAKIFKVKLFFDTRGLLADKYVCGGLLSEDSPTYKIMRRCEDFLLKHSEVFTVETKSHAELLSHAQNYLTSRMHIIPCCVDTSRFDYQLCKNRADDEFRLIYLGQIGTWYLLDEMLDFFKTLSQELPRARLTIVSENDPGIFYSAAERIGISKERITARQAGIEEIPDLLAAANAGIFFMNPYKRYNTFPIKFGEYLASGLPVIVNKGIGDCDQIIGKERVGAVINDFSSGEYKNSVETLKTLLKEGDTLRERCRSAAEEHCSLSKGIESYWAIYKSLAGTGA